MWISHHPTLSTPICFLIRLTAAASGPTFHSHSPPKGKTSMHAVASWNAPSPLALCELARQCRAAMDRQTDPDNHPKAVEDNRTPRRYRDKNACGRGNVEAITGRLPTKRCSARERKGPATANPNWASTACRFKRGSADGTSSNREIARNHHRWKFIRIHARWIDSSRCA